jgi:hypothetical protein
MSHANAIVLSTFVTFASISAVLPLLADDSAASIAAGGLVAKRETRIVMAKEVLRISPTKVLVDYDFRNDTDQDVTTEVAFPIPPYTNEWEEGDLAEQAFRSFKVWVDGKPIEYKAEARAFLKGKDVTSILGAEKIDVATYGHFHFVPPKKGQDAWDVKAPDFSRLSKAEKQDLVNQGILSREDDYGQWTVHLQYHWTQTFPAHSTIHIRHEYKPAVGFSQVTFDAVDDFIAPVHPKPTQDEVEEFKLLSGFCPDQKFLNGLGHRLQASKLQAMTEDEGMTPGVEWVDFILTSANTWKQPIEDFTLIVERSQPLDGRGKPEKDEHFRVSFCSPQNAPVDRLDANRFQIHLTNFVPNSELHIGYFELPETAHAPKK